MIWASATVMPLWCLSLDEMEWMSLRKISAVCKTSIISLDFVLAHVMDMKTSTKWKHIIFSGESKMSFCC